MPEYAEFHPPESLSLQSLISWLLACWVSLSWMSEYAEFYSPESLSTLNPFSYCRITWSLKNNLNLWDRQVSLLTLGMLSFTLLWVCRVSLSWISEYAEFPFSYWSREVSYSPESLRSPSFFHDCWHAEFHSLECLSTQSFTLLNLWVCKVYLMTPAEYHSP
jgi:hypothetical protein